MSLSSANKQRPGETLTEYIERLQRQAEEATREKEEAMRREKEERRGKEEAERKMENLLFLDFVKLAEELLFLALLVERDPSKSGQTDVGGKMYPRTIQPWADFEAQHTRTFGQLREVLDDKKLFESVFAIETRRQTLCRRIALADEEDTRNFAPAAIEDPVADIVRAYHDVARPESAPHEVRFQNNAYGKLPTESPNKKGSPTKDQRPDRWVFFYRQMTKEVPSESQKRKREVNVEDAVCIAVGECKPPNKLKNATLQRVFSNINHDTFFRDAVQKSRTAREGNNQLRAPGHVLVAQVLSQAYHYMMGSGCEYGYILSGDSLVLLRVLDDCTLLYHLGNFQVPNVADSETRRLKNHGLRQPSETVVAHLVSLCLWACETTPRPLEWKNAVAASALRWPSSKKKPHNQDTFSLPDRAGDNDLGGGAGGGAGGSGGGGGGGISATAPHVPQPLSDRSRERSPMRGTAPPPPPRRFVVEPPTLPYCTQACLQGLVRGGSLDGRCPNAALHRAARHPDSTHASGDLHPLTASELCARIVAQLAANMDKDCECAHPHTLKARYGRLFKLAVTGFGYMFVGKGVRAEHRHVLEHEEVVYRAVPQLQGILIPVFLGLVDLQRPIPLPDLSRIAHLMLLSYAGPDLCMTEDLPADVDMQASVDRTTRALQRAGVYDEDVRAANMAWSAERQEVMHFDFDCVDLTCLPRRIKEEEKERNEKPPRSPLLSKKDWNAGKNDSDVRGSDGPAEKRLRMTENRYAECL